MMYLKMISRESSQSKHENIQLSRADIYRGYLILVNQENPVRSTTSGIETLPSDILQSSHSEEQQISLEKNCLQQLSALLDACQAKGSIAAVSGYRSKEAQERIYADSLKEHGAAFTASYVALPGASEHQTGLAIDVGLNDRDVDYIRPAFPDDGVSGAFKNLAAEYGFIQRYQEDKKQITGIACEPWHYRYVGFPHSLIMKRRNLCLEEYTEYIKQYPYHDAHLYFENDTSVIEIYYVESEGNLTVMPVMSGDSYQWSGNNKDGYVVTVFHHRGGVNCD